MGETAVLDGRGNFQRNDHEIEAELGGLLKDAFSVSLRKHLFRAYSMNLLSNITLARIL